MANDFNYFFSPIDIGPVTIRNRTVISGHHTAFSVPRKDGVFHTGGNMGERYAAYVGARAKGGVGLIILGQFAAHPTTKFENPFGDSPGYDEEALAGMKMCVDAVHQHGAKAFVQFFHSGFMNAGGHDGTPVWSASELQSPRGIVASAMAKAMEKEDIEDLKNHYVLCARNARLAGADGVEIHAAHSYLLNQFLSPVYNKRTDEYGGSLENRARLLMEVLELVRKEIGKDMALGVRVSTDEYSEGGLTIDDHRELAQMLEAQGAIDFINASQGLITHNCEIVVPMNNMPHAVFASNAAAIKEVVNRVKVIAVGRIIDPVEAEKILADGHADLVVMTRAHVADPEIVNKTREGRLDEIRACAGDGNGCGHFTSGGLECTQNPCAGREDQWSELIPASKKKKVMIVGGGVAGLECAWVAAARGHDVTVYEKSGELGGQVLMARELPGQSELDGILRWRKTMVDKYGVKVLLNTEVTPEQVASENPDAVVIATGGIPRRDGLSPYGYNPVAGYDSPNVCVPEDILSGRVQAGQNVVVYDPEGFSRGAGIAEKLVNEGKTVTYICPDFMPAGSHNAMYFLGLLPRLNASGMEIMTQNLVLNIAGPEVMTMHLVSKKMETLSGVDNFVIAGHGTANNSLYQALKGKVPELHRIGDAWSPRRLDHATLEGHRLGRKL